MCDYNCNATYLAESDQIITLNAMETDESSLLASFQELENTVPEWEKETQFHPSQVARASSVRTPD